MPKRYGARNEGIPGNVRRFSTVTVFLEVCRTKLGPLRRDPHGTFARSQVGPLPGEWAELQGASAKGGSVVTNRDDLVADHERQPSRVMPRSTTFEFGVCVLLARLAHVNRASSRLVVHQTARSEDASNHRRTTSRVARVGARRCTLQNGLPAHSRAAHEVHG
jgi:hypothetical protein